MTRLRDIYGPGFSQDEYLRALAAGYETGWWDDNGVPAPWPEDFTDHDQTDQEGDEPPI
jgi:hypothetical protein